MRRGGKDRERSSLLQEYWAKPSSPPFGGVHRVSIPGKLSIQPQGNATR